MNGKYESVIRNNLDFKLKAMKTISITIECDRALDVG